MELSTVAVSLAGGILIGLSAGMLLIFNGKIAGVSGILGGFLSPLRGDWTWRAIYLGGLAVGGLAAFLVSPESFTFDLDISWPLMVLAGLLVGVGARMGGGCTSGHGICGMGRFSFRSLVSVVTFTTSGAVAVYFMSHVL